MHDSRKGASMSTLVLARQPEHDSAGLLCDVHMHAPAVSLAAIAEGEA